MNAKLNIKLHDIPGSIFVEKRNNTLIVQVKNKRHYTGLKDTPNNRKHAEKIKENLYLEAIGLKETTVITRKYLKDLFNIYISEREINKAWRTVELDKLAYKSIIKRSIYAVPDLIESEVKAFLSTSKIQNSGKNIYMRTFQTFLNWLHEHGHISDRLNLRKKYYFKIPDNENEIFYDDEIKLLFSHFNKTDREFSILIEFLLLTGFRIGEALTLQWSQIKKSKIILANKVNKTSEFVILSPELLALLEELKPVNKEKVFRWKDTSYSRLNRRLSQACEKLGIEKRERSFHEFRKTFLYKLQRADVPVEIAQKLMRHKNISVTIKNYQLIKDKQLENVMNSYSKTFQEIKESR